MERAEEVQASLSAEYPTVIRCMLPSHIASGFWLGLPTKFCDEHLPISDTIMKLIDESGEIFNAKYLAAKVGLSGGWRGFSIAHSLEEGDVMVFQLVKRDTFKVYIVRHNALGEIDGALGLLDLDNCADVMIPNDGEKDGNKFAKPQEEHGDSFFPDDAGGEEEHEKTLSCSPSSEGLGSEVLDWIRLSESESVNLKSFNKFSILLDDSVSIDAMIPDHIRRKYYNLCTNHNSSLHKKLLKGMNCTLVVGIINQTINICDAIRGSDCRGQASESEHLEWDRTLQSFEMMGMNVRVIRMQIRQLMGRVLEQEVEAKMERETAGERTGSLEVKFLELKKQMDEIDEEIEMMEERTKRNWVNLQKMVD